MKRPTTTKRFAMIRHMVIVATAVLFSTLAMAQPPSDPGSAKKDAPGQKQKLPGNEPGDAKKYAPGQKQKLPGNEPGDAKKYAPSAPN